MRLRRMIKLEKEPNLFDLWSLKRLEKRSDMVSVNNPGGFHEASTAFMVSGQSAFASAINSDEEIEKEKVSLDESERSQMTKLDKTTISI